MFGAEDAPTDQPAEVFGGYARGCLAGALQLAADGPGWQAMRLSRNRRWGHPDLIAFVERLSDRALAMGWGQVLVGDLSQPRGGPMLTGHRSHQIGIDADIWLMPAPREDLTDEERETLSAISMVGGDRRSVSDAWTPLHRLFIRAAADDPAVARIFVNGAIKQELCREERSDGGDSSWLRVVRPWYGHTAHMHVRLHCPTDSPGCTPQDPPPPGDGCDEVAWWLSDEVLFPQPDPSAPAPEPRRELTMGDLPAACQAVLDAVSR